MIDRKACLIAAEAIKVHVLYTSDSRTPDVLRTARKVAHDLNADIELLVVLEVPYGCSLGNPLVDREVLADRLRKIVPPECERVSIRFCLGRDRLETLSMVLPPESIVLVGAEAFWRPFGNRKLVRELARRGHDALAVGPESQGSLPDLSLVRNYRSLLSRT